MRPRSTLTLVLFNSLIICGGCATTDTASINPHPGQPTRLIVHFNGVKSDEGEILAFVHDNAVDYHSDDNTKADNFSAFRFVRATPTTPATTVVFDDIPAGRYAISGYHDEDGDGALDRMILPFPGMPSEPYGIANNVFAGLSKPAFKEALIEVTPPETELTIELSTHLRKLFR